MASLAKIKVPSKRALYAQKKVQEAVETLLGSNDVSSLISCKKGCSACCHTQVSITDDEAELFAELLMSGHDVDIKKLQKQKEAGNDAGKWYQLSYEERGCIFLDKAHNCSIYDKRPMVCRSNYVLSNPLQCDTSSGKESPVRMLNTEIPDMLMMGAFLFCKKNGAMPSLLWKTMERWGQSKKKISKKIMHRLYPER